MRNRIFQISIIAVLLLLFVGCDDLADEIVGNTPTPEESAPEPEPDLPTAASPTAPPESAEPIIGQAVVDSIEIQVMESFPVQISVRARGDLPDACTTIDQVETTQDGDAFTVSITTTRPGDAVCAASLVPFEETIPLNVSGLPAGTYTVSVNGNSGSFTLAADNEAVEEPPPEPTETAVAETEDSEAEVADSISALINGRIWHDLCAVAGGEEGATVVPSAGCVGASDGTTFVANGQLEDGEPGLEGILVSLGEGGCPAVGLDAVLTDTDGDYIFADLAAGNYCVSVDPEATENAILLPGEWTYPGIGETAVTLTDGEVKTDINFGWDYLLLPAPEVAAEDCTNAIAFVADINIPDDTPVNPGEAFQKGWRLRNSGTCPWTTDYSLVFAFGDLMSATTPISLTAAVLPDQEVDVFVDFTTPEIGGTYRSDWHMADADGILFGVDGLADQVFWVQIVATEVEATAEPNSATIGGVVWDDICFLDGDGDPSVGCLEIEGTGLYRGDGSLINEPRLVGVTVLLADGACPDAGPPPASAVVQSTLTDEDGLYRFTNLPSGLYCVAIDALSADNVDLLIPGNWTWPAPGTGRYGINLFDGGELLETDFGWDFQE